MRFQPGVKVCYILVYMIPSRTGSPPVYGDSHCHLLDSAFDGDREAAVERARSAGLGLLVETACRRADWEAALLFAARHRDIMRVCLGIHPEDCAEYSPAALAELADMLNNPLAVGLGEIGLDYAWDDVPRERQLEVFAGMLGLASGCGRPIVLHCRGARNPGHPHDAYADLFSCLRSGWKPPAGRRLTGILHCFSGTAEDAESAASLGLLLGVNGSITYPKNSALRETAARHRARVVFETDCPYLPPQSCRGRRNEPSRIPEICAAFSSHCGIPPGELAASAMANCAEVFSLLV